MDMLDMHRLDAFQSTFPRGERRSAPGMSAASSLFQSTFPRGERPRKCVLLHAPGGFNPRSREGNDRNNLQSLDGIIVSIHVPARGTTTLHSDVWLCNCSFNPRSREGNDVSARSFSRITRVSIHVPARGTTKTHTVAVDDKGKFQSTFPRGERRFNPLDGKDCKNVSIHVPARGTTICCFNLPSVIMFQSTFPRGERR